MGKNYRTVRNSHGIKVEIGSGKYLSVGRDGKNVMIRGNGMEIVFPSWERLVSAIDLSQSFCYKSIDPVRKRIGECRVDQEGLILILRRQYYQQGWIFKDWYA